MVLPESTLGHHCLARSTLVLFSPSKHTIASDTKKVFSYVNLLVAFAKFHNTFPAKCRSADFANKFTDLIFHFARLTTEGLNARRMQYKIYGPQFLEIENIF